MCISRLTNYIFLIIPFALGIPLHGQPRDTLLQDTMPIATDSLVSISTDTLKDTLIKENSSSVKKDTVSYKADFIEYDLENKIILMYSNGEVSYHDMTLYADTIHLLLREDVLVATGHPQLIDGEDTVVGDNMVYNLVTKRGKVTFGTAHSSDSKYNGNMIAMSDDKSFYIEDGAYTSCAKEDTAHYCFYGRHIKIIPSDKAISRPVVLNVGDAPIIVLPYFVTPLERGRQSGWLTPRWGGNFNHGGRLDNIGYYWALNDYSDLTLSGRVMEFQSYEVRAHTNYKLRYLFDGSLDGSYAIDNYAEQLKQRWQMNYRHNQDILPDGSMKLVGSGSIVSDKNYYKMHSVDTTELLNQQQTNANLSLSKNFKKINANANVSWNRTQNFRDNIVNQDLPSFGFNLSSRPLIPYRDDEVRTSADEDKEKWYNKIRYSYSLQGKQRLVQRGKGEPDEILRHHGGVSHNIPVSANFKLFKWFNISPFFNISQSLHDAYIDTFRTFDTVDITLYDTIPLDSGTIGTTYDTITLDDTTRYLVYSLGDTTVIYSFQDTTYLMDNDFSVSKAHTYWWNTGLSMSTRLYGLFPIKIFNFTGMRHTLSPSVSYTFTPKKEVPVDFPGIGVSHAPRSNKRSQSVSFRIGNLFEGRAKGKEKKDSEETKDRTFSLLNLSLGASYDFEKESRNWSDISLSASIPNKLIDFTFNSTFTPYNAENKLIAPQPLRYSFSLRPKLAGIKGQFWGGDFIILEGLRTEDYMQGYNNLSKPGWSASVRPDYNFSRSRRNVDDDFTTDKSYRLSASANIKFSHIWSAAWGSSYNFEERRFMNNSVNFICDLECWEMNFNWNPSGLDGGSFYFIIKIKKHPEIKWEHPENRRRFR